MSERPRRRPIRFDERLHRLGNEVEVESPALVEALAWGIAAELVRRHPRRLRVIETHPGGGQYDCVSVYMKPPGKVTASAEWALVVHLNKTGSITHGSWFGRGDDERFNWLEVFLAADLRTYVIEQLEGVERLARPSKTPRTTADSIGPRLISAFLARLVLSSKQWTVENGYQDTSGHGGGVREDLFAAFPGAARHRRTRRADDLLEIPEYRYWFLVEGGRQVPDESGASVRLAVDCVHGLAWNAKRRFDLLAEYKKLGRSIDALVNKVCPPAD